MIRSAWFVVPFISLVVLNCSESEDAAPAGQAGSSTKGGTSSAGTGGLATNVGGAATDMGGAATDVGGAATDMGGAATDMGGAATDMGGAATDIGGAGGAGSPVDPAFGSSCEEHVDCTTPTDYCAKTPFGPAYCTASGCDEDPSVCPDGWTCFDVGQFAPGQPWICTQPM